MSRNYISAYRMFLDKNQTEMAKALGISVSSYRNKENGRTAFSDKEKIIFKELLIPIFPEITID